MAAEMQAEQVVRIFDDQQKQTLFFPLGGRTAPVLGSILSEPSADLLTSYGQERQIQLELLLADASPREIYDYRALHAQLVQTEDRDIILQALLKV